MRMGILGCGGRATAVGTGFVDNTNTRVVALVDLFADQLEGGRKHFDEHQQAKGYPAIDSSQLFHGPRAYQQIAASKEVDFILITTPPYFHPLLLENVVAAGKHVYCEKPVAVDVAGAKRIMRIGEKAQGKLSLEVGFQIRKAPPYVEPVKRIQGGALDQIGCGLGYYYCGHIDRSASGPTPRRKGKGFETRYGTPPSRGTSLRSRISILLMSLAGFCEGTLNMLWAGADASYARTPGTAGTISMWFSRIRVTCRPVLDPRSLTTRPLTPPHAFSAPRAARKRTTTIGSASPEPNRGTRVLALRREAVSSRLPGRSKALRTKRMRKSKSSLWKAPPAAISMTTRHRVRSPRSAPCWDARPHIWVG